MQITPPSVCVSSHITTVITKDSIVCILIDLFKLLSRVLLRTRKWNFGFLKMRTPLPPDQRNNTKYPRINNAWSHNNLLLTAIVYRLRTKIIHNLHYEWTKFNHSRHVTTNLANGLHCGSRNILNGILRMEHNPEMCIRHQASFQKSVVK
jgi:hypothetical protein